MKQNRSKKRYWKSGNRTLLGIVLALIVFGLVAVSSASAVLSFERFGHNNYYFFRQIFFAIGGIVLIFVFSAIDYHQWKKWSKLIYLVFLVVLAAVLVPGIGTSVGGSRSWFNLGFGFLQPSEFAKLAVIFYLAHWFEQKKEPEKNFWFGVIPPLVVVGILIGLIIIQPDLGTAGTLVVIGMTILIAAQVYWRYLGGIMVATGVAIWLLIKAAPYRAARIVAFFDPSVDPLGISYHINQALLAIGSGGLWGFGFGGSRQKHNFLPEPIGDSIFAVMAEELGFVRIVIIIVLFLTLGLIGMRIAKNAPDKFGQLTAVGITGWIVFQALINIAAIVGLLPLTGITLPFISYGGSSLLAVSAAVGILLNISKQRESN